jgi:hypothetical protein
VIDHGMAARLLFGWTGLLLIFSACSDSDKADTVLPAIGSAVSDSATTVAAAPPVAADPTATTTVAAATLPPVDGAALLQQAVAASGDGYHFNQTATVEGVVALTVDGDRLPDGTRLTVTGDGGLVSYIITPAGTWLMPEDGEWEVDDSPPPAVDPIAALSAPTSVAVAGNDGTAAQLVVTVPVASLGIPGDGDAALEVSVVSGVLTSIAYSITLDDGRAAAVNAVIGPVVDSSAVVAPI